MFKNKLIAILLIVLVSGCIDNPYQKQYLGQPFNFRADLNVADKVDIYDADQMKQLIFNPDVTKIWIAYYSNTTDVKYYGVSVVEVGAKLASIYKLKYGVIPEIGFLALNNTDELDRNAAPENPVILLLGQGRTQQTSVGLLGDNIVVLEGKSFDQTNRKYTDLDLAVAKFILTLMEG